MNYTPTSADEQAYLASYDPSGFPSVALTVDMVIFTIRHGVLSVLMIERGGYPYKGAWALPGGFVNPDEDADTAAARELREETGIDAEVENIYLEQLRTYTSPNRDPRMRVVSTAYVALVSDMPSPVGGDDASDARWWAVDDLLNPEDGAEVSLAFDHDQILRDGLERVRAKLEYSPVATSFLDEEFTLADLRRVYETVWGFQLHPGNFRRKVLSTPGFVVSKGEKGGSKTGGRTAALYTAGDCTLLHPAILRDRQTKAGEDTDD